MTNPIYVCLDDTSPVRVECPHNFRPQRGDLVEFNRAVVEVLDVIINASGIQIQATPA